MAETPRERFIRRLAHEWETFETLTHVHQLLYELILHHTRRVEEMIREYNERFPRQGNDQDPS